MVYTIPMIKSWPIAIIALVLLGALALFLILPKGPRVLVQRNPQFSEAVYSLIGSDGKKVSFTVYQTEINDKVLRFRSDSTLPLKEQLQMAAMILDRIKKDLPLNSFKTLSIGRLVLAFGTDDTFSRRLTAAAHSGRMARPLSPIPFAKQNNAVRDIANRDMIYLELRDLFSKYGIAIKVSAVEKVLVNRDGVPYDCMTWFSMTKQTP